MNTQDHIQLCNEGDVFYRVNKKDEIIPITIIRVADYGTHFVYESNEHYSYFNRAFTDKTALFETTEEAKLEIQKRKSRKEKRELLKKYEAELNIELGLSDYIVK